MTDTPDTPENAAADPPEKPSAGDSPWYVLMTVAGEQTSSVPDLYLHARNRRYWNGWQAQALVPGAKRALIDEGRATADDLAPLTKEEKATIAAALADRCPSADKPDSADPLALASRTVERTLICIDFLFSGPALFRGATFSGSAIFLRATFFSIADFVDATFHFATFQDATFSDDAIFVDATFSGSAIFVDATFSSDATFRDATFSGDADFQDATFSGDADFQDATFSGNATFQDATFSSHAIYTGAEFKAPTIFLRAKFPPPDARPPEFFNATLHEDTEFHGIEWPQSPRNADEARAFRRAYERLKLLMDGQKKTHDEHMFHRLEQRCREIEAPGSAAARLSRAFGWASDYGWSLSRPAIGLALLLVAGWAAIFLAEWADYHLGDWPDAAACAQGSPADPAPSLKCPEYLGPGQSGAVSLSNVFGFLGFGRTFLRQEVATLTTVSEVVSATQTILGLVLFFLFGLALRNNFRMR